LPFDLPGKNPSYASLRANIVCTGILFTRPKGFADLNGRRLAPSSLASCTKPRRRDLEGGEVRHLSGHIRKNGWKHLHWGGRPRPHGQVYLHQALYGPARAPQHERPELKAAGPRRTA